MSLILPNKFNKNRGGMFQTFPLWLLLVLLFFIIGYWKSITNDELQVIFFSIVRGLGITVYVTFLAYSLSLLLGLCIGLLRSSRIYILSQIAKFYIEIIRGLPILIILYYIAFVMAPKIVDTYNFFITPLTALHLIEPMTIREFGFLGRAIIALVIAYSAFIAEIFRAGIEAIDHGQVEAAKSVGFSRLNMFFPIIFPQAIRNVLPALANDLVAMLKDSSLVSVLGVVDITQIAKIYSTSTFKFFETYNIVALLYLTLTITLSLGIKFLEKKFSSNKLNYNSTLI